MRIQGGKTPEVEKRDDSAKPQTATSTDAAAVTSTAPVVVVERAQQIAAGGQRDAVEHGAKLSALKQALDKGTYKVDYDKLADKIVTDEIERARKH